MELIADLDDRGISIAPIWWKLSLEHCLSNETIRSMYILASLLRKSSRIGRFAPNYPYCIVDERRSPLVECLERGCSVSLS